jgi:hypothetical protein
VPRQTQIGNALCARSLDLVLARGGRDASGPFVATTIIMLILGILYHIRTTLGARSQHDRVKLQGLARAPGNVPVSLMLLVAVLLLIVSLLAAANIDVVTGP